LDYISLGAHLLPLIWTIAFVSIFTSITVGLWLRVWYIHVHSHTECMSVLIQSDVIAVQVSSSGDETTSMSTAHRALVQTPKSDLLVTY